MRQIRVMTSKGQAKLGALVGIKQKLNPGETPAGLHIDGRFSTLHQLTLDLKKSLRIGTPTQPPSLG